MAEYNATVTELRDKLAAAAQILGVKCESFVYEALEDLVERLGGAKETEELRKGFGGRGQQCIHRGG